MLTTIKRYALSLLGSFHLAEGNGAPIAISSKKSVALIAMLATSPNGERTRAWLQERLWGSRGDSQARASMRRELSNLRKSLGDISNNLLQVDSARVRLRLENVAVDVVRLQPEGWAPVAPNVRDAEFLEGIDVRGEEGFEAWLRLLRGSLAKAGGTRAFAGEPANATAAPQVSAPASAAVKIWLAPVDESAGPAPTSPRARAAGSEIAGLLARVRWLRVVAGVEASPSDGETALIVERAIVAADLGEAVELRLLSAAARELIWSEKLPVEDGKVGPPAAVRLAARLVSRIEREEQTLRTRDAVADEDFRTLIWRGRWRLNRLTQSDSAIAVRLIDRALALSPLSPEALIQKAVAFAWERWARRAARADFYVLAELARQAMLLDPDDCRGYWLAGVAENWLCNSNTAIDWLGRAIEIEPTFEPAYAQLASVLNMGERPAEALEAIDVAMSLSPNDTHVFFRHTEAALSLVMLGRFEASLAQAERALLLRPGYWFAQTIRIHALVEIGRSDEARRAAIDLRRQHPGFGENFLAWVPFLNRAWPRRLMASVQRASEEASSAFPARAKSQSD